MKNNYLFLFLSVFLLTGMTMYGQQKTISGTVVDEQGIPLPGVNVLVKGTTTGVQTNFDGKYSLNAELGQTLVFSFIGYKTEEVEVGSSNTIDVILGTQADSLEEVVVVGYGTTTKRSFTGSITSVDAEELSKKNVSNVGQALAGEAAGVRVITNTGQPGSEPSIRIRGIGSINGNRSPLIVLDGIPFNGNLSSINPADIASTTILKDASATAIYGSRGANGVIVITTKKGKGESYIEVETKTGKNMQLLPNYNVIKSPETYVELSWEALYNKGVIRGEEDPTAFANTRLFSSAGISPNFNIWDVEGATELIDPQTGMVRSDVQRLYTPEDWREYAFQPSTRNEVNLNLGGGTEESNYYASVGYLNDVGYSVNSDFKRYSARLNVNHQVKEWLSGNFSLGYAYSDSNNNGQADDSNSIFWFTNNIPPIYGLFLRDENGQRVDDPIYGGFQYDYGENGRSFGAFTNAIADATFNVLNSKKHELNTNISFKVDFTDWLSFENRFGLQYYDDNYDELANPYYGSSASQNGSIYKQQVKLESYNLQQLLRFKKEFDDHGVEALLAHESTDWRRKVITGFKFNLVDPDSREFSNAVEGSGPSSYTSDYAIESYFAQLNYDYADTYFLSGTIRRDGSSRFLNNKWGTFGSVGAAWVLSNEDFLSDASFIEFLKLKTSYGLIGDQGNTYSIDDEFLYGSGVLYPGFDLYDILNLNGDPAFLFNRKGNPDLTWEVSKMFQTGVELGLGGVVDISLDYYIKNTEDLLFERQIGPSIGYSSILVNDGALRNSGLEFNVNAHLLKSKDFFLDLGINGEIIKNELKRMPIDPSTGEEKNLDVQGRFGRAAGRSVYDYYIREWAGVDSETGQGTWVAYYDDANGDGVAQNDEYIASLKPYLLDNPDAEGRIQQTTTTSWNDATLNFVGKSAIPDVRGGINLAAGYKNFSLSVQGLYSMGGYSYDAAYAGLMDNTSIGGNNWHTDILNRWQEPGDITDVPRLSDDQDKNVSSTSTRFLEKADYFSLNNVRVGYTIPEKFTNNIGVKNIELWASGDNLMLFTVRDGFNPSIGYISEAGTSSTYSYNPLSTISAGLRVKF